MSNKITKRLGQRSYLKTHLSEVVYFMEINNMQLLKADTFISFTVRECQGLRERNASFAQLFDVKCLIKVKPSCKQLTCTKRIMKFLLQKRKMRIVFAEKFHMQILNEARISSPSCKKKRFLASTQRLHVT